MPLQEGAELSLWGISITTAIFSWMRLKPILGWGQETKTVEVGAESKGALPLWRWEAYPGWPWAFPQETCCRASSLERRK